MINIEEILDGMFTPQEYNILDNLTNLDVEVLKEFGTVTEEKVEENGIIHETITFASFDGKHNFVRANSYFKANAMYEEVKHLNQQIKNAANKEDYELAASLKTKKDTILGLNSTTKTINE